MPVSSPAKTSGGTKANTDSSRVGSVKLITSIFQPFKQWAEQDTETYIIGKSQAITIGDAVQFNGTQGAAYLVGSIGVPTSVAVYGIVVGFAASPAGTIGQQSLVANTYSTTATNQTTEMVRARVLPVRQSRLFIADLHQTAGTTTGSGDPGYFNLNTQALLSETTYAVQVGTAGSFFSIGSGYASSANGPTGLFPASVTQVVGFFSTSKTV